MESLIVTPTGSSPITVTLKNGWNRITDDIGCAYARGTGVRFVTRRGGEYRIQFGTWDHAGYLPPRAILTIRPDSPAPTLGLLRPHGNQSDYGGVSGLEIEACGSGDTHDHDAAMQRCPIGLYDMTTGRLRTQPPPKVDLYYRLDRGPNKSTTLPEYVKLANPADIYDDNRLPLDATPISNTALRAAVLAWWAYNGQHIIRGVRAAIRHLTDPFVAMDVQALAFDASLAWDAQRQQDIEQEVVINHGGSIQLGREFGWCSYLFCLAQNGPMRARMTSIAINASQRRTGILQRNRFGIYNTGSPAPWGAPAQGGSGVPTNVDVAQDLECYAQIIALFTMGAVRSAELLSRTVLSKPLRKWIGTDDGQGYGVHPVAIDQAWPALGAWAIDGNATVAIEAMKRWPIPTQQGGQVGPFGSTSQIRSALIAWNMPGKSAWALAAL